MTKTVLAKGADVFAVVFAVVTKRRRHSAGGFLLPYRDCGGSGFPSGSGPDPESQISPENSFLFFVLFESLAAARRRGMTSRCQLPTMRRFVSTLKSDVTSTAPTESLDRLASPRGARSHRRLRQFPSLRSKFRQRPTKAQKVRSRCKIPPLRGTPEIHRGLEAWRSRDPEIQRPGGLDM